MQSKKMSILEAVANLVFGYSISVLITLNLFKNVYEAYIIAKMLNKISIFAITLIN